jgi:hypothetical protein
VLGERRRAKRSALRERRQDRDPATCEIDTRPAGAQSGSGPAPTDASDPMQRAIDLAEVVASAHPGAR